MPCSHRGNRRKAQSNVVGAILITALLVAGIGATFVWGIPLIQKNQDQTTIDIARDALTSVNDDIVAVARQGGTRTSSFELRDGFLTVETERMVANNTAFPGYNLTETDYIQFQATTQAAYISTDQQTPVNENDVQGTSANSFRGAGVTGRDNPGVILGSSETLTEEFRTTLQLEYRLLREDDGRGFKIDLVRDGQISAADEGTKEIVIARGNQYTRTLNGEPVNVVEVRIRVQG